MSNNKKSTHLQSAFSAKAIALIISLVIIWLAAMTVASKYDLNISLAVADKMSVFGRLLEVIGEPPAILFTSFNFSLICACLMKKPKRSRIDLTLAALSIIVLFGSAFYTVHQTFVYILEWRSDLTGVIHSAGIPELSASIFISTGIGLLMLVFSFKLEYAKLKKLLNSATRCVLAAICTLIAIWFLKLTWGRVRFRQMDGNFSLFTPWYIPRGFTGFYSFPSGHTANAAVIFTLVYYLKFLPQKYRLLKPLSYIFLTVWVLLLAFSRVRVGAHFLSDVLCGAAVTFAIVYFFRPKSADIIEL